MATVNGNEVVLQGKSYVEIGELLRDATPLRNGIGLTVKFTLLEESVFLRDYPRMTMRMILEEILFAAIRVQDGNPNVVFSTYSDHVYETELK